MSEVSEEKISAGGRKGAEEASLAIADFKKISPRVRYVVSYEEEKIDEAPRLSAVKIAEEVVSSGAKKLFTLPAEEFDLSHIMKGGEKIEPVPCRFLMNSEHGVYS
jgi:hypothetical protein